MIVLNVPYIFAVARGTAGLLALIREDYPDAVLSYPTVQMWRQRNAIPGVWIAAILCALTRRGHALLELMTSDDPFADAAGPPAPLGQGDTIMFVPAWAA